MYVYTYYYITCSIMDIVLQWIYNGYNILLIQKIKTHMYIYIIYIYIYMGIILECKYLYDPKSFQPAGSA